MGGFCGFCDGATNWQGMTYPPIQLQFKAGIPSIPSSAAPLAWTGLHQVGKVALTRTRQGLSCIPGYLCTADLLITSRLTIPSTN